jgi:hypothetical protein
MKIRAMAEVGARLEKAVMASLDESIMHMKKLRYPF